jgi:hypothetical protein
VTAFDAAAELAKIEADYEAEVAEIRAELEADLKELRELRSSDRFLEEMRIASVFGGELPSEHDLRDRADRRLREADERRLRRLQALERMRGLRKATRSRGGHPDTDYDGLAVAKVVRELKLAERNGHEPRSPGAIAGSSKGALSRNAVLRIERLIDEGVLDWDFRGDRLGINGEFRATPEKISLRALERAAGLEPLT